MNYLRNERIVKESCRFIEDHLGEILPVTEVAKHLGYSNQQYIRIFKGVMGMPPSLYVRNRKLEQAKKWLAGSEMTVTEIARQIGYTSLNNFTRMFQREVGMNPSNYQKFFKK